MRVIRGGTIALSALSVIIYLGQLGYRYSKSGPMLAPCDDAIGAFLAEHWECSRIRYTPKHGLHFLCIGDDYELDDNGITDEHRRKLVAFNYTNLTTMRQGSCDCQKSYGVACEDYEYGTNP